MTSDDSQHNDAQEIFDDLMRQDHFDDSVGPAHRDQLRNTALGEYDRTITRQADHRLSGQDSDRPGTPRWTRNFGYLVALAVCLLALMTYWLYRQDDSVDQRFVRGPIDATHDVQLLDSLATVNSLRHEVSADSLFTAYSVCEIVYTAEQEIGSP